MPNPAGLHASWQMYDYLATHASEGIWTTRGHFLLASAAVGTATGSGTSGAPNRQTDPAGFSTLTKQSERLQLLTPGGPPFFSRGLNHIDLASLRYPENLHIWKEEYRGSTTRWIRSRGGHRELLYGAFTEATGWGTSKHCRSPFLVPSLPGANTPRDRLSRGMRPGRTPDGRVTSSSRNSTAEHVVATAHF